MRYAKFELDEQYITNVNVTAVYDFVKDRNNPSHEDLIKILKGHDKSFSFSDKDHDEFTKLREQLGELGYIEIQRGWWNGDRVIKPFYLNEWLFRKGHKFPCAAAMKVSISCARKHKWKSISSL
jgi:hypothetical protein